MADIQLGGVAERLNAPVLKTGEGASPPWVRIPPPPPLSWICLLFNMAKGFYGKT